MNEYQIKRFDASYEFFMVTFVSLSCVLTLMYFTNHWILFWIFVGLVYTLSNSGIFQKPGALFK